MEDKDSIDKEELEFAIEILGARNSQIAKNLGPAEFKKRVFKALRRAYGHRFFTSGDRLAFAALMFKFSPRLDQHPEIREILSDPMIPAEKRLDALFSDPRISSSLWHEIETSEAYGPDKWSEF